MLKAVLTESLLWIVLFIDLSKTTIEMMVGSTSNSVHTTYSDASTLSYTLLHPYYKIEKNEPCKKIKLVVKW